VAPPGNQAANGENKRQPEAMGGPGLLDINIWSKSASLALYQAIKKRLTFFKTPPYVQYAFVLENGTIPPIFGGTDPFYTVLNSNFMQH